MRLGTFLGRSMPLALALAALGEATLATALPASAQMPPYAQPGSGYEGYGYDSAAHVLHGTVASFSPYRLLLARDDQETTEVDLKHGTAIDPVGTSITPGMHVRIRGYWSKGVFIANRVMLR